MLQHAPLGPLGTTMACVLGAGLLAVVFFLYRLVWRPWRFLQFYRAQGIPGMPFVPVLGQLLNIARRRRSPFQHTEAYEQGWRACSTHFLGPGLRLNFHSPGFAQEVLITKASCFGRPAFTKQALADLIGRGLPLLDGCGADHARQRKVISPAFHFANLKAMTEGMVDAVRTATSEWLDQVEAAGAKEPLAMHRELSAATLRILTAAVFGGDLPEGTTAEDVYDNLNEALEIIINQVLSGASAIPGFKHLPLQSNREAQRCTERLNKMMSRLIRNRRESLLAAKRGDPKPTDLLAILLAAADGAASVTLSETELRDEAMTFIVAGAETTTNLMTWVLVNLCKHPEWLAKVRAEVDAVLGGAVPTYEHLSQVPLLSACLLETLRLNEPVPYLLKHCVKDVTLNDGPHQVHVKAGTVVRVVAHDIHRNAELWESPDEWRPERFRHGQRKAVKHPMAFIPFSAGKTNCVGQNFALLEAKVMLITIMQRLEFELDASYVHFPIIMLTVRPKYGLPMRVRRRTDGPGVASSSARKEAVRASAGDV